MEKRINKVLLLVTIALLGPLGLSTVAAASPNAPQTEGWAEASNAALSALASAPLAQLAIISTSKTRNSGRNAFAPTITQNFLTQHLTYTAATILYVRAIYAVSSAALLTPSRSASLPHHLGGSAGGIWRLSLPLCIFPFGSAA